MGPAEEPQRELALRLLRALVEVGARASRGFAPKMAVWERFGASRPLTEFWNAVRYAESEGWLVTADNGFRLGITDKGYELLQKLSEEEPE